MNINTLKGALPIAARLLAEKCGLKVRIGGNRAYANPSEIVLPDLPIEVEKARVLGLGFVLHEGAGHIVHTDFESVAAMDLPAFTFRIYNALEDVRIEGLVERRYPGANRIFMAMRETLSKDGQLREMSNSSDLAEGLITATVHTLNWRQLKRSFFETREAIAVQWLTSAFDSSFANAYLTVISKVQFAHTSTDAARIAVEAVSLLQQYAEENSDPDQDSSDAEDCGEDEANGDSPKADSDPNGKAGSGGDSGQPENSGQGRESGGDGGVQPSSAGVNGDDSAADDGATSTDEGGASQGLANADSVASEDPSSAQGGSADAGGKDESQPDGDKPESGGGSASDPGDTSLPGDGLQPGDGSRPGDGSQSGDGSGQNPGSVSATEDGTGACALAEDGQQQDQANDSGASPLDLSQKATSRDVRVALGAGYNPGEDLGEIVQGVLNGMADESDAPPVLSNAIPFTEEIDDNGEIVQRVKRESIALRRRLTTALEAITQTKSWDAYAGERLSNLGALRLSTGDLNIFERESSRNSIDVAIHLFLDRSGSMQLEERMTLAIDTCTALGIALGQIDGVQVATSAFPAGSRECDRDVLMLNRFGESVRKRAGRIAAVRADGHNTPLADALLYGQYSLLSTKATRRILLPITDGVPDSKEGVVDVVASCQRWGIEVIGVGIGQDISGVIPNSICIKEVADLPTQMFELLRKQLVLKKAA
ncbi:VWA domain-containing protein [Burkholderia cepacia]|uniref:VWA domain-containing protein n=1 Tax=Burkholderia cepacia TaxID=292 RepID=UPI0026DFA9E5|nr:VWA domain-containing protein [Burkholderia cepacia]MDO5947938.1 VWA domain-containing protein [Burkholderia cepacia]